MISLFLLLESLVKWDDALFLY